MYFFTGNKLIFHKRHAKNVCRMVWRSAMTKLGSKESQADLDHKGDRAQ